MRKAAVAGQFYPANEPELRATVMELIERAPEREVDGEIKIAVVPHAGYRFSGLVAATVYKLLKKHEDDFKDIILLGPIHYYPEENVYAPQDTLWEFPWGVEEVGVLKEFPRNDKVYEEEHSHEVQFPFIHYLMPEKKVYPLAIGEYGNPFSIVKPVLPYIREKDYLLLISTDLSHYYSYERAMEIDSYANKCIPAKDIPCVISNVKACGKIGLLAGVIMAELSGYQGHFLYYMNSGDVWWDKSQVVGYGAYVFTR